MPMGTRRPSISASHGQGSAPRIKNPAQLERFRSLFVTGADKHLELGRLARHLALEHRIPLDAAKRMALFNLSREYPELTRRALKKSKKPGPGKK